MKDIGIKHEHKWDAANLDLVANALLGHLHPGSLFKSELNTLRLCPACMQCRSIKHSLHSVPQHLFHVGYVLPNLTSCNMLLI